MATKFAETSRLYKKLVEDVDQKAAMLWAADCTERVLRLFEEERPGDKRPREAIEACRAWVLGEIKVGQARKSSLEAHAAAREAVSEKAVAVARAAGHAAATAHVKNHAAGAAAYAAKALGYSAEGIEWQKRRLKDFL
jgi:hypothetical protein